MNSVLPCNVLGTNMSHFVQEMSHYLYSAVLLWSTEERAPNRKYDVYSITPHFQAQRERIIVPRKKQHFLVLSCINIIMVILI